MTRWVRHGAPAAISVLLAVLAAVLTNVVTADWNLPAVVGLVVLAAVWVGWEMRLTARLATWQVTPVPSDTGRDHPPLRPPAVPKQLPAAPRHFVGRVAELAALNSQVDQQLASGGAVVISSINGTAGIGKTTLAVTWAHQVADRFPDGQLYVNLRGFDRSGPPMSPAQAVRQLLDALQVPPERIPASLDAQAALYRSLLAARRVLVVLDNARDAEQVRPLLPASPRSLVLVTSRNELPSLVTVEGAHPLTLDLLSTAEAHQLLAARLGPARLDADPGAATEIITRCAQLPLALAIVAARAAARPGFALAALAQQLADQLGQGRGRLDALSAGDPASDVRAVFSWSYRLLSVDAARLFRLLGLQPGSDISVTAAARLTGTSAPLVLPLLGELTEQAF